MIVIVDYGVGNVGSVHNMLRKIGVKSRVSCVKEDIQNAEKLILPGVGHFGHGMNTLKATGLIPLLKEQVFDHEKPLLGICLGMQMLTNGSEESDTPGLGWINAYTHRFPNVPELRIPHMGWNAVRPSHSANLFTQNTNEAERFYFVHSYYVKPAKPDLIAATCEHGIEFAASIQFNNLYGVQFHPEKSHMFGMTMLRRFANL